MSMHLIVILLGFTGVLGKLIDCSSSVLVWYRMFIAFLFLLIYIHFSSGLNIQKKYFVRISLIGVVVAAHWLFFFESIKVSNVSVAVVCMGTSSLFSAFLEPIILKRRFNAREIILSVVVIFAISFAMQADWSYKLGFVYGIIAAFLGTLFTIYNSLYINKVESEEISLIEMLSGFLVLSIYFLFTESISISTFNLSQSDLIYLLILGIVCTSFAFAISVEVMKKLSPYNVIMAVNLEPIYSIILALVIFGDSEKMSLSFYIGAILIIATVTMDGIYKQRKLKNIT